MHRSLARLLVSVLGGSLLLAGGCREQHPSKPAAAAPAAAPKLTFNESIEPILSENCYQCHGPDPGSRKAGLRLDRPEFAFANHGKSGPAILPRDPEHSPLILRVTSHNPKVPGWPAESRIIRTEKCSQISPPSLRRQRLST